jgi:hypothetical protein
MGCRDGTSLRAHLLAAEQQSAQPVAGQIMMSSHVRKNASERADADGIVVWDRDVVLAVPRRRQAHVATGLTSDLLVEFAQSLRGRARTDHAAASCREDFIPHEVKSNHLRPLGIIEMAADRVAYGIT